jgi:molybdopterin synthase sulfur carrier subunit
MSVTIHIPTPLRAYTGEQASVEAEGDTVGTALQDLVARHPALKQHLYDEKDTLRSFVNVYVGDEDIRYLEREQTPLSEGAELSIVPSIAGGSAAA